MFSTQVINYAGKSTSIAKKVMYVPKFLRPLAGGLNV